MTVQTQREYLASLTPPLAIPGARGRLSAKAHEALAAARAKGITFAEDMPPEPKVTRVRKAKPKLNLATPVNPNVSDETPTPTEDKPVSIFAPHRRNWTDAKYLMFAEPAGKTWFKTPCTECGYSVGNCRCGDTHVWDKYGRVKCELIGAID